MRISIPTLPYDILHASPSGVEAISASSAVQRVSEFLSGGKTTLLSGAGVSVDSGIRAYRGHDGRYMNPNYKPIFYQELVDESAKGFAFRQRYWLRSFLGYLPVKNALPNTTHCALAALQYASVIPHIITQNVDGLHHKALLPANLNPVHFERSILELHGSLHRVRCKNGHLVDRTEFQQALGAANPQWQEFLDEAERTGSQPRTNPDGDVAIEHLGVKYSDFVVPDCPSCIDHDTRNNTHKPDLIFFGESIPTEVKERSFSDVERTDRLLVMGTTLATYSAFRILKHALDLGKQVLMVNVGPSRGDGVQGVEKLDIASGAIMDAVTRTVLGSVADTDPVVKEMLAMGIVKPPAFDDDDPSLVKK
ncbi:DHS-like NAD/FAD-binding domain-containing protein [Cylindrobasidium torrendii FP15055 ss-10]|uniref:DHS-like NAD/FAD-binding domain-containing protein n=1 Tax=Cylindrobasidium torrendii FP15055 ss-10 TaxID=1314674 RepID=A0A0D7BK20_9AGAR|nr:DHS-like NAD/FAD-binding domain-containing protein [Cylindrobasidium torrendii FP15055 ss-10]